MKRITIGRYDADSEYGYAGWIEGVTDDEESWILYIDKKGRPEVFWPYRDEDGGVKGSGIILDCIT